jgi:protein involved in polysaccharide export with SLBB domain
MRFLTIFLAAFLFSLCGCRSPQQPSSGLGSGPEFRSKLSTQQRLLNLARLDDASFNTVTFTNAIQPQWLIPPTNLFRLGPGDWIEIEDLGNVGVREAFLVGPDGKIYYNLLPGVSVWGLTLTETKELLERDLSRYIRVRPELGVSLKAVGSKRVWILGSVQAPGVYPVATPLTVLEALSLAGGVALLPGSSTGMPDLQNSFIMRQGVMLHVDFHRLISRGDLTQNIYLQPDDFVFLRTSTARNVYVLGAVSAPNIIPYSDQLSVLSAIASAGGTLEYARVGQVAIVRGSLNSPRIALLDYKSISRGGSADYKLQPGDIVYVPFVAYRRLALLAEELISTVVRTTAINEGNRAVISGAAPVSGAVPFGAPPTP